MKLYTENVKQTLQHISLFYGSPGNYKESIMKKLNMGVMIAIGAAVGVTLDNITLGIVLGTAIGIGLRTAHSIKNNQNDNE